MQKTPILRSAICGLALFSFASSAQATMSFAFGYYFDASLGYTKIADKNYPSSTTITTPGAMFSFGYKFMPFFGTEIFYIQYADINIVSGSVTAAVDKHYTYGLAMKGIVPFVDSGFEGFAKVGIQRLKSKVSIQNSITAASIGVTSSQSGYTGLFIGAGAQYYFSPGFAVIGQWTRAQGNSSTGTLDLWSVGVSYLYA